MVSLARKAAGLIHIEVCCLGAGLMNIYKLVCMWYLISLWLISTDHHSKAGVQPHTLVACSQHT